MKTHDQGTRVYIHLLGEGDILCYQDCVAIDQSSRKLSFSRHAHRSDRTSYDLVFDSNCAVYWAGAGHMQIKLKLILTFPLKRGGRWGESRGGAEENWPLCRGGIFETEHDEAQAHG